MSAENKSFELIKSLLTEQYGAELAPKILSGYFAKRKPSLRINPLKGERKATLSELKSEGIELTPSGWYEDGFMIENASEPDIQALPAYAEGRIYLQSLSSMLPPVLMKSQIGTDILDMAAAPGSKTTQLAAITKNGCRITACDQLSGKFLQQSSAQKNNHRCLMRRKRSNALPFRNRCPSRHAGDDRTLRNTRQCIFQI